MAGKACPGEGRGPAIHAFFAVDRKDVDSMAKPRHDDSGLTVRRSFGRLLPAHVAAHNSKLCQAAGSLHKITVIIPVIRPDPTQRNHEQEPAR
jgi:hypothetical protein